LGWSTSLGASEIMNYQNEYRQAKKLLDDGSYNLGAMQCGRILESILRDLLKKLLTHSELYHLQTSIKRLLSNDFENSKRLTLGKLILLIKRTNAIKKLSEYHDLDKDELCSIDFETMITIRNKASHEGTDDSGYAAGADAHIIFGYLLKFLGLVEPLLIGEKKESLPKSPIQVRQTPQKKIVKTQPKIILIKTKTVPNAEKHEKENDSKIAEFINVCKNKSSGAFFIFLNNKRNNKALFILPDGKEKILSLDLFHEAEEVEMESLISKKLITKEQFKKLNSIKIKSKSTRGKRIFIKTESKSEPDYIMKFRHMLNNPNTIPSIMLGIIKQRRRISWKDLIKLLMQKYGYKDSGSFGASLRVLTIDGHIETEGRGDGKMIFFRKGSTGFGKICPSCHKSISECACKK
jgi:hypothetical protein